MSDRKLERALAQKLFAAWQETEYAELDGEFTETDLDRMADDYQAAWVEVARSALTQPQAQQEPVAVIGEMFNLFWIGSGPIAPIIERHGLKVGDKLYVGAPTQAPQTKAEIAYRLRWLSKHMIDIAASMDYCGGMAEWAAHGVQMAGAAHIANQWADEIEQEITT